MRTSIMLHSLFRCITFSIAGRDAQTRDPIAVEMAELLDALEHDLAALRREYCTHRAEDRGYADRAA